MKLSVVVPIYNIEKYLAQCVESVLSQDYDDVEVILVDDGSKDSSAYLCDKLSKKDSRVKVIHKENGGLSDARNSGILASTGEYIIFLDGDDMLENGVLHIISDKLEKNFPDILVGGYREYYDDRKLKLHQVLGFDGIVVSGAAKKEEIIRSVDSSPRYAIMAWRCIVKRKFIIDENIFFKRGIQHEDDLWTPQIMVYATNISMMQESLYIYRIARPGSIMSTVNVKNVYSKIEIVKDLQKIASEKNNITQTEKRFLYNRAALMCVSLFYDIYKVDKDRRSEVIKIIKTMDSVLYLSTLHRIKILNVFISIWGLRFVAYILNLRQKMRSMRL